MMGRNLFFILVLLSFGLSGCTSLGKKWKELISSDSGKENTATAQARPRGPSYSQQKNLVPNTYRKYKRVKRQDLENQARLDSRAGSLWVMEGQGAYLFSQNIVRMIGDPLAVRIEGEPREQLSQKSEVVATLLKRLEERRKLARMRAKGVNNKQPDDSNAEANPQAATEKTEEAADATTNRQLASKEGGAFNVSSVPTRIVERMVDGNYRVKGAQPFMIGSREYKVIVSGIVRSEDFNEQGISSTQLLDPKFDIVSSRSTETN